MPSENNNSTSSDNTTSNSTTRTRNLKTDNSDYASYLISSSNFIGNNVSLNGAGLVIKAQQMSIETVNFTQNTALGYGGGISAESSYLSVRKSIFNMNKANSGAGIRVVKMDDKDGNAIDPQ